MGGIPVPADADQLPMINNKCSCNEGRDQNIFSFPEREREYAAIKMNPSKNYRIDMGE